MPAGHYRKSLLTFILSLVVATATSQIALAQMTGPKTYSYTMTERCKPSLPTIKDENWRQTSEIPDEGLSTQGLPMDAFVKKCEVLLQTNDEPVKVTPGLGSYISGGGDPHPDVARAVEFMREQAKINRECGYCHKYHWGGHGGDTSRAMVPPLLSYGAPGTDENYYPPAVYGNNSDNIGIFPDSFWNFDCSGMVWWGYQAAGITDIKAGTMGQAEHESNGCTNEQLYDPNQTCWVTGDLMLTGVGEDRGGQHVQIFLGWDPENQCMMTVQTTSGFTDPSGVKANGAQEICALLADSGLIHGDKVVGKRIRPAMSGGYAGNPDKDKEIMGHYVLAMLSGQVTAWEPLRDKDGKILEEGTLSLQVDLNNKRCVMHYSGLDPIIKLYPGTRVEKGQRIGGVKADESNDNLSQMRIYLSCDNNDSCINPLTLMEDSRATTVCRKSKIFTDYGGLVTMPRHAVDTSYSDPQALCKDEAVIGSQPQRTGGCIMRTKTTEVMTPITRSPWLFKNVVVENPTTGALLYRNVYTPFRPEQPPAGGSE